MNKRFAISVVVLFIVSMALDFVIHGALLGQDYQKLAERGVFRSEAESQPLFGAMLVAHVLMAIGFTWIYRQGREGKPFLWQGVRFGIAVSLLCAIPNYLIYYVVQPLPSDLVAKQIALTIVQVVILGIVAAAVNRDGVR